MAAAPARADNGPMRSIHDRLVAMSDAVANISAASPVRTLHGLVEEAAVDVPDLVARAKEGDTEAFGNLYRLYFPRIYKLTGFLLKGRGEDAAAETFVRAWKALPRYRDRGVPFLAWLYAIARNVARDEMRAASRVEPRDELWLAAPEVLSQDDRLSLIAAVQALPGDQRRIIEMKYLLGMTNPEVAAALGKSIGAVNAQQWRALRALEGKLGTP